METIQSLLKVNKVTGSERNFVMKEIFEIYLKDRVGRKKENWKRYIKFLKEKKLKNSPEAQKLFKKTKSFIKESTARNLAVKLSHIPTKDLYYIKSVAQDKLNRGEPVGSFIFGSIKLSTG